MNEDNKRMGRKQDLSDRPKSGLVSGFTYFVGIGIDHYAYWGTLKNAVRDVKSIADLLVAEYGFDSTNLRLLLNENATQVNIINLFEELANVIKPSDSLLIYYAGHGHLNQRGRGFWVPVDAPKDGVFRYIRNSTIKDYIGEIKSLHTLLISDACFSGSLFTSGSDRSSELVADELARLPSRWAICSGRHDETVADGPTDGHSPFAESILDVLRNNNRQVITTGFLVNQVIEQTRSNYEQLPDGGPLQNVGHKRGQFVFRRKGNEEDISDVNPPEAKKVSSATYDKKPPVTEKSETLKTDTIAEVKGSFYEVLLYIKKFIIVAAIISVMLAGIALFIEGTQPMDNPLIILLSVFFILAVVIGVQSYQAGRKTINYKAPLLIFVTSYFIFNVTYFLGNGIMGWRDTRINLILFFIFCLPGFFVVLYKREE